MIRSPVFACCLVALTLQGCALTIPRQYADPGEITLPQAMGSIACGIATMGNEFARYHVNAGNIIDEMEVTLNVTAGAVGTSGLVVNTAPAVDPSIMASMGVNYSDSTQLSGNRGSVVRIKLRNLYTVGLNKPGETAFGKGGPVLGKPYGSGPVRDVTCVPISDKVGNQVVVTKITDPAVKKKPGGPHHPDQPPSTPDRPVPPTAAPRVNEYQYMCDNGKIVIYQALKEGLPNPWAYCEANDDDMRTMRKRGVAM